MWAASHGLLHRGLAWACVATAVGMIVACEAPLGSEDASLESPDSGAPVDPLTLDELFDPDHVVHVDIDMPPADWDALRSEHPPQGFGPFGAQCHPFNHSFRYGYRLATVTVDGRRVEHVGVRKKAYCGSEDQDKPGLKIAFDEFVSQTLGADIGDLTLNNAVQDGSYVRQCLGMQVFARAGLPALRCNFATVSVNGDEPQLYLLVERWDQLQLERELGHFGGNLYEGTLSDFHADWLPQFEPKSGPSAEQRHELEAAAEALADESQPVLARVAAHFDLDAALRYWAVEVVLAAWDGYHSNQNNFFVYADPRSERLHFLPWGLDHVFANVDAPAARNESYLGYMLYADPGGRDGYYAALDDVLRDVWRESELLVHLDHMAEVVLAHVPAAEREDVADAIERTRSFVENRRSEIDGQLIDGPLELGNTPPTVPVLVDLGALDTSFSTTWDSLGGDPTSTGQGTAQGSVEGYDLEITRVGATIGPAGDSARVVVAMALANGDELHLFAVGPSADIAAGAHIDPNYTGRWRGGLSLRRPGDDKPRLVARLIDGTLAVDQGTPEEGAAIAGRLAGRIVRIE